MRAYAARELDKYLIESECRRLFPACTPPKALKAWSSVNQSVPPLLLPVRHLLLHGTRCSLFPRHRKLGDSSRPIRQRFPHLARQPTRKNDDSSGRFANKLRRTPKIIGRTRRETRKLPGLESRAVGLQTQMEMRHPVSCDHGCLAKL